MRVYVQLRNVFKEFEIGLEFALNDAELGQYKHLKKEYEELVEKHGKAMEVYLKMVKEFKEGKRDKIPENHPGNGPTFEGNFEQKYETMKMDWNRRWHSIELEGKTETNMVELIEKAQKWFEPKIGVPQFVAGKYRAFREEKDKDGKVKIVEIWPNNAIGHNDKIFFEFIR